MIEGVIQKGRIVSSAPIGGLRAASWMGGTASIRGADEGGRFGERCLTFGSSMAILVDSFTEASRFSEIRPLMYHMSNKAQEICQYNSGLTVI